MNFMWRPPQCEAIRGSGSMEGIGRHVRRHKVREAAGRGANEVLAWVAAFAAFSAGGQFTIEQEFYEAIPGWITGMAMMAARQADCLPISATKSAKGGSEAASVTPAFYWRLRQQCRVHAFAHSDVRTDELSETEFNGGGRLQAHISFNRIGILLAAMRSVIREKETKP